jgi:peptide/nickel transport system permease protein
MMPLGGPLEPAVAPPSVDAAQVAASAGRKRGSWLASRRFSRRWGASRTILFGGGGLAAVYLLCIVVPLVWAYKPNAMSALPLQDPSLAHPFGTDELGRDVMARAFEAGRLDISVALFVVAVSSIVGTAIGCGVALTAQRWIDPVVMRLVDALIAFPYLVVLLLLVTVIGPGRHLGFLPAGLPAILVAFLCLDWTFYSRLGRGQAMSLRDREYVLAARLAGFSQARILMRHIIPIVFRQILAYAVLDAIVTMGALASFAFLGVGVQPPTAEWGNMMFDAQGYISSAPWMLIGPAVLLAVTGLCLSVLADGLLAKGAGDRR